MLNVQKPRAVYKIKQSKTDIFLLQVVFGGWFDFLNSAQCPKGQSSLQKQAEQDRLFCVTSSFLNSAQCPKGQSNLQKQGERDRLFCATSCFLNSAQCPKARAVYRNKQSKTDIFM